jgi:hypothetical protein
MSLLDSSPVVGITPCSIAISRPGTRRDHRSTLLDAWRRIDNEVVYAGMLRQSIQERRPIHPLVRPRRSRQRDLMMIVAPTFVEKREDIVVMVVRPQRVIDRIGMMCFADARRWKKQGVG